MCIVLWRTQVLKGLLLGEDASSLGFLNGGSHESSHSRLRSYELHDLLIRLHSGPELYKLWVAFPGFVL